MAETRKPKFKTGDQVIIIKGQVKSIIRTFRDSLLTGAKGVNWEYLYIMENDPKRIEYLESMLALPADMGQKDTTVLKSIEKAREEYSRVFGVEVPLDKRDNATWLARELQKASKGNQQAIEDAANDYRATFHKDPHFTIKNNPQKMLAKVKEFKEKDMLDTRADYENYYKKAAPEGATVEELKQAILAHLHNKENPIEGEDDINTDEKSIDNEVTE